MPRILKPRAPQACTLAIALMLAPCLALADAEKQSGCTRSSPDVSEIIQHPALYNFRLENDVFNGTDSGYTSGVNFSWVSANLHDYLHDPCMPHWVRQFNQFFEAVHPSAGTSRNMVVTAGQLMFTPQDMYRTDVIRADRPYAGWLYLGLGYNARNDQRMDSVEVNLGVVGPAALGQQLQNFIHDLRGVPRFNGWDNQLKNELGVQLIAERKKRIWESKGNTGPQLDAIAHYGTSLGNVKTYLNTGLTLRIGNHVPNDFGTSPIRSGGDSNAPLEGHVTHHFSEGGLHAFISADARLVARDIFLDGNTFAKSHHIEKGDSLATWQADSPGNGLVGNWPMRTISAARTFPPRAPLMDMDQSHSASSINALLLNPVCPHASSQPPRPACPTRILSSSGNFSVVVEAIAVSVHKVTPK